MRSKLSGHREVTVGARVQGFWVLKRAEIVGIGVDSRHHPPLKSLLRPPHCYVTILFSLLLLLLLLLLLRLLSIFLRILFD